MGQCDINRISSSSLNSGVALFHTHVNRNLIHQVGQVHTHSNTHMHTIHWRRQWQILVCSSYWPRSQEKNLQTLLYVEKLHCTLNTSLFYPENNELNLGEVLLGKWKTYCKYCFVVAIVLKMKKRRNIIFIVCSCGIWDDFRLFETYNGVLYHSCYAV